MKLVNYITKNIDKWLDNDIEVLDNFFKVVSNTNDPVTRYSDFVDTRSEHIRNRYWEHDTEIKFPFMSYWVDDYQISNKDCNVNVDVIFRFVVSDKNQDSNYSPESIKVNDPVDWASNLQSIIVRNFNQDNNLFKKNECIDEEVYDCNGNMTVEPFKFNVRAKVFGNIKYLQIFTDQEYFEFELRIPLKVYKIFKDCPCGDHEDKK